METVQLLPTAVLIVRGLINICDFVKALPRSRARIVDECHLISAFRVQRGCPVKVVLVRLENPLRMLRMQDAKRLDISLREALASKVRDKCVVPARSRVNPDITGIEITDLLGAIHCDSTLIISAFLRINLNLHTARKLHGIAVFVLHESGCACRGSPGICRRRIVGIAELRGTEGLVLRHRLAVIIVVCIVIRCLNRDILGKTICLLRHAVLRVTNLIPRFYIGILLLSEDFHLSAVHKLIGHVGIGSRIHTHI